MIALLLAPTLKLLEHMDQVPGDRLSARSRSATVPPPGVVRPLPAGDRPV